VNQIIGKTLASMFLGVGSAIGVGVALYIVTLSFKFVKNDLWRSRLYFFYFLAISVGVPLGSHYSGVSDCKYIALITFAYLVSITNENPDNDLPIKHLEDLWIRTMFLVYGSVSCELRDDQYMHNASVKWRSFLIIIVGLLSRFVTTLVSTFLATGPNFPDSCKTSLNFN
jgi:hypothetical protein